MRAWPLVTLVIPCRNEERYLRQCLDTILENDYPKDRLEILVAEGRSKDRTREILKEYAEKFSQLRVIDNPKKNVCAAMNAGIQEAQGEIIFKMDAHSLYEKDYVRQCVEALETSGADNVGGKYVLEPGAETPTAKAIALAMGHPFGIGQYYQWMQTLERPTDVETVSFGCFRKEMLAQKQLSFNEELSRGGDSEFNMRLREKGGKVLLLPDIVFRYFGRPDLPALLKHQWSCSYWVVYWTRFGCKLTFRSFLPMLFVLGLLGLLFFSLFFPRLLLILIPVLIFYAAVNLYFSWPLAVKEKDPRMLFLLPLAFATIHFSRGFGALTGLWRLYADR